MKYSIQAMRPSNSGYISFLPRLLMSLLALAFFAAGIGVFIQHIIIARTWQSVEATIVSSEVVSFRDGKQREMYRGEVELAYAVDGKSYTTPDTFKHASSREEAIRRKMETTYAEGTRHRIFYNPKDPYAILWNVGINFPFLLLPFAFTSVGLILIGVCYFLWRLPYPELLTCRRCAYDGRPGDHYCPRCGAGLESKEPRAGTIHPSRAASGKDAQRDEQQPDDDFELPATEPPRENSAALKLVGAFFAIPGLACLAGAVYIGINTYSATHTWPTAQATVTQAMVETQRARDGTPIYRLAVEFDYSAARGSIHAAGQSLYSSSSYGWIVKRRERFPVGSRHTIRVNSRAPADIRFDTESRVRNWLPTGGLALLGGIFAAIGLGLLASGLQRRCQTCQHRVRRGAAFCAVCGTALALDLKDRHGSGSAG